MELYVLNKTNYQGHIITTIKVNDISELETAKCRYSEQTAKWMTNGMRSWITTWKNVFIQTYLKVCVIISMTRLGRGMPECTDGVTH